MTPSDWPGSSARAPTFGVRSLQGNNIRRWTSSFPSHALLERHRGTWERSPYLGEPVPQRIGHPLELPAARRRANVAMLLLTSITYI